MATFWWAPHLLGSLFNLLIEAVTARRLQKNNKHNNNNLASRTSKRKLEQTNNMARQMPKQEWFVYTGEGVIPEGVTHVSLLKV